MHREVHREEFEHAVACIEATRALSTSESNRWIGVDSTRTTCSDLRNSPLNLFVKTRDSELEVHFEQQFSSETQKIYFALSYPFSYQECQELLNKMDAQNRNDTSLYFNREVLI